MAEAGNVASGLGLPGEVSQWPLRRYGRFMLLDNAEAPGPSSEAAAAPSPTWKVRPEGGKGRREDPVQPPHKSSHSDPPTSARTGGSDSNAGSLCLSRE